MMPVIGNIACLMTRRCYVIIESRESWDSVLRLTSSDVSNTECLVMVERLFLAVPWGCLRFVIVLSPDHTHLLFLNFWRKVSIV